MIQITKKQNCTGCYACANKCPQNCITMKSDTEGFWYPDVDVPRCIDCDLCEKVCPIITPLKREEYPVQVYAAYNTNEKIRLTSSSGGIFTLIAETIINRGGVVFGAGFNANFEVIHIAVETIDDLEKIRGSKYVQSKIGNTYKKVEAYLKMERSVLFTGTPCQIAGLKAYLNKEYEKLFCQDIICHGVPSPLIWKKYIAYRKKTITEPLRRISFRRKDEGWKRYSVTFSSEKVTEYRKNLSQDSFMKGFLSNLYLRPSCHACHFKTIKRQSDLTLADFWGIENILPEMDDDKGTSLILIQSAKGQTLFEEIKKYMIYQEVDLNSVKTYNTAAIESCKRPEKRDQFYECFQDEDFERLVDRLTQSPFSVRIKRKMVCILDQLGLKEGIKKVLKR